MHAESIGKRRRSLLPMRAQRGEDFGLELRDSWRVVRDRVSAGSLHGRFSLYGFDGALCVVHRYGVSEGFNKRGKH